MNNSECSIIVGVLGQWVSEKTLDAKTLVEYLGGKGEVIFLTDRFFFTSQVVNHILELDDARVTVSMEEDGRQRYDGELATLWLRPGENLRTVDVSTLNFDVYDEQVLYDMRNKAKVGLGSQIKKRCKEGKPVVLDLVLVPILSLIIHLDAPYQMHCIG